MATGDQSMESNEKVQGSCSNEDALQDFTRDELIKAISKYKIQMEEMKNQLHTLKSDKPDFVIRKENSMYEKRNKILVSTNTLMSRQLANRMMELKELQTQNEFLQNQINATQSIGNSSIPAENHAALEEKCAELQDEILKMREYLKHYYADNSKLKQENDKLERYIQEHKNSYDKLIANLSVLVKERDELRKELEIAQKNPIMCSAPYNEIDDMAKKQCEVLEERCRVTESEKVECEKALSSRDYHIQEQEVRIESLMKKLDIYGRDAEENERKDQIIARLTKEASLLELEVKTLKEKIENQNSAEHDKEFVQQQLKAFQDDWSAENEEKAQIMQEKRMLENDNKMLRKQLSETHPYPQYPIGGYGPLHSPPIHTSHQEPLDSEYVAPNLAVVPSQSQLVSTSAFAPAHGPSPQVYSQPYGHYRPGVPGQFHTSQPLQGVYYPNPHNQYTAPRYPPPNNVVSSSPESNTSHETNYIPNQPTRRS